MRALKEDATTFDVAEVAFEGVVFDCLRWWARFCRVDEVVLERGGAANNSLDDLLLCGWLFTEVDSWKSIKLLSWSFKEEEEDDDAVVVVVLSTAEHEGSAFLEGDIWMDVSFGGVVEVGVLGVRGRFEREWGGGAEPLVLAAAAAPAADVLFVVLAGGEEEDEELMGREEAGFESLVRESEAEAEVDVLEVFEVFEVAVPLA